MRALDLPTHVHVLVYTRALAITIYIRVSLYYLKSNIVIDFNFIIIIMNGE